MTDGLLSSRGDLLKYEQQILHTVSQGAFRGEARTANTASLAPSQHDYSPSPSSPSDDRRGTPSDGRNDTSSGGGGGSGDVERGHERGRMRYVESCRAVWNVVDSMGRRNVRRMIASSEDRVRLCGALIDAAPLAEDDGMRLRKLVLDILVRIIACGDPEGAETALSGQHDTGIAQQPVHDAKPLVDLVSQRIIGSIQEESHVAQTALKIVVMLSKLCTRGEGVESQLATESTELPILDLLAHCLNIVSPCESVEYEVKSPSGERKKRTSTGQQFKKMVIERLCGIDWPAHYVNSLAIMFKELPLDDDELRAVCDKLLQCVKLLKWSDLATFIHHLLVISHKGLKAYFLKQVVNTYGDIFYELLEQGTDNTRAAATDILYHLSLTCMKDQKTGRTFLKLVKEGQIVVNHFAVGFMLVLAKVPSIKKTVFSTISKLLQDFASFDNHIPLCWGEDRYRWTLDNVEEMLMSILDRLRGNREYLCHELSDLAFFLIDAKPKDVRLPTVEEMLIVNPVNLGQVGWRIVEELFQHESAEVRNHIVSELLTRIITGSGAVFRHLALLKSVIASSATMWHDYESKFKDTIEYLTLLPQDVASGLLQALDPLFQIDRRLPDKVIKVLRKSLFSNEEPSRTIAIRGFFTILHSVTGVVRGDGISPSDIEYNRLVPVQVEILSLMKRGLSLQFEVRRQLYEGYVVTAERKPHLREIIFRHLSEQLSNYYTESPRHFISFSDAIDERRIIAREPAAHLLFCCQRCVLLFGQDISVDREDMMDDVDEDDIDHDHDDDDERGENHGGVAIVSSIWEGHDSVVSGTLSRSAKVHLREIVKKLESIRESLECEDTMSDFGFEKNSEYAPDSDEGRENLLRAYIAQGVHLSILEYTVMTAATKRELGEGKRKDAIRSVEKIFQSYIELRDTVNRRSRASRRHRDDDGGSVSSRSTRTASAQFTSPQLLEKAFVPVPSLDFVTELIRLLVPTEFDDDGGDGHSDDDYESMLLTDPKFIAFVLQLARTHVALVKTQCEKDLDGDFLSRTIPSLGMLCGALIQIGHYLSAAQGDNDDGIDGGTGRGDRSSAKGTSADAAYGLVLECVDMVAREGRQENDILAVMAHAFGIDTQSASLQRLAERLLEFVADQRGSDLYITLGLLVRLSTMPSFNKRLHRKNMLWLRGKDEDSTYVMERCQEKRIASTFFDMLFRYLAMESRFENIESLCATVAQYATGGGQVTYIIPDRAETAALESSIAILQKLLDSIGWKRDMLRTMSKMREQLQANPSRFLSNRIEKAMAESPARNRASSLTSRAAGSTSSPQSPLSSLAPRENAIDEQRCVEYINQIIQEETDRIYERLSAAHRIFEKMFQIPRYTKGCDTLLDSFLSFISLIRAIAKDKAEEYVTEERRLKKLHAEQKQRGELNPSSRLKPQQNFGDELVQLASDTNHLVQQFDQFVKSVGSNIDELPKSTLQRWGRIHPEIDSVINEYERHLSTLSKKTGVNLLLNAKARLTDSVKIVFNVTKTEGTQISDSQSSSSSFSVHSSSTISGSMRRRGGTVADSSRRSRDNEDVSQPRSKRQRVSPRG